jgi:hypothetical protein
MLLAEGDPHRLRRRRNLPPAAHSQRRSPTHRMNQDLSIITLVLQASLVVQVVMAGLMVVSLASWTVIFGKLFGLRACAAATRASSASSGPAAASPS